MTLSILIFMSTVLAVFSLSALAFFSLKMVRSHYSPLPNNFTVMLAIVVAFVVSSIVAGLILGFKDPSPATHLATSWQDDLSATSNPQTAKDQQPTTAHQGATRTGRSISFVGLIEPLNTQAISDTSQHQNHHMVLADVAADEMYSD